MCKGDGEPQNVWYRSVRREASVASGHIGPDQSELTYRDIFPVTFDEERSKKAETCVGWETLLGARGVRTCITPRETHRKGEFKLIKTGTRDIMSVDFEKRGRECQEARDPVFGRQRGKSAHKPSKGHKHDQECEEGNLA